MKTPEQYADAWMNSPALAGGYLASRQRLISMLTEAVAEAVAEERERWAVYLERMAASHAIDLNFAQAYRYASKQLRLNEQPKPFGSTDWPQSSAPPPDLERWCADKFKEMNERLVELEKACAFVGYIHDIHVGDDTLIARIRALESWRDRISKP
jgi:hypothetical protein